MYPGGRGLESAGGVGSAAERPASFENEGGPEPLQKECVRIPRPNLGCSKAGLAPKLRFDPKAQVETFVTFCGILMLRAGLVTPVPPFTGRGLADPARVLAYTRYLAARF